MNSNRISCHPRLAARISFSWLKKDWQKLPKGTIPEEDLPYSAPRKRWEKEQTSSSNWEKPEQNWGALRHQKAIKTPFLSLMQSPSKPRIVLGSVHIHEFSPAPHCSRALQVFQKEGQRRWKEWRRKYLNRHADALDRCVGRNWEGKREGKREKETVQLLLILLLNCERNETGRNGGKEAEKKGRNNEEEMRR